VEELDLSYMGTIFKTARISVGMTQEKVAKKLNITPRHLIALEKGERYPSLEKMLLLAHLFNIPGDALVHPQLVSVNEEDQRLLRLLMQLNTRNKKIILATIQAMLD